MILGGASIPLLKSAGLRLSVASGLDGVMHVAVVADPVARRRTARGSIAPSLDGQDTGAWLREKKNSCYEGDSYRKCA
jgi:hypothetical protein